MRPILLGIDAGTTSFKAVAVDFDGREHPAGTMPTPWRAVPTGAEADPEELVATAVIAARRALAAAPAGRVVALGVTSMAEAGVLLGDDGRPRSPVIAWHDTRGVPPDLPHFSRRTGLPLSPTPTIAKHKALGLRDGRRWLSVAEWIVLRLGGDPYAELSLAARTGYLDLARRAWWPEALDWTEAPPGLLPEPAPAGTAAGRCSLPEARGALLTIAGHDHTCACVGAGALEIGDVLVSCGTAEALVRGVEPVVSEAMVERAVARGLAVGWHVIPERQTLLGGFPAGKVLAEEGPGAIPRLAEQAAAMKVAIEELAGPTGRLIVTGGLARREEVRRAKEQALGPFLIADSAEAAARGAALLAGQTAEVIEPPHARRL